MHTIGRHTYHGAELALKTWQKGETIEIGSFCSIAEQVTICAGGSHRIDLVSTFPLEHVAFRKTIVDRCVLFDKVSRTVIGNDVWIGLGATIMGGARVGHGAVVGAHAVVHGKVPPYAVVSGNPAEVMFYRFPPDVVQDLLRIAWWDWPDALIEERLEWFYKPIREFVQQFRVDK
jgi:acetyltransferase-like isoleucine patch superfamily enzyme